MPAAPSYPNMRALDSARAERARARHHAGGLLSPVAPP
jgi:hypothetical protein